MVKPRANLYRALSIYEWSSDEPAMTTKMHAVLHYARLLCRALWTTFTFSTNDSITLLASVSARSAHKHASAYVLMLHGGTRNLNK